MTNITIDTSALIAVITQEPNKDRIVQLTEGANLLAPLSVHWEIGNKSPLDIESVPLDLTAEEIVRFIHEGRK